MNENYGPLLNPAVFTPSERKKFSQLARSTLSHVSAPTEATLPPTSARRTTRHSLRASVDMQHSSSSKKEFGGDLQIKTNEIPKGAIISPQGYISYQGNKWENAPTPCNRCTQHNRQCWIRQYQVRSNLACLLCAIHRQRCETTASVEPAPTKEASNDTKPTKLRRITFEGARFGSDHEEVEHAKGISLKKHPSSLKSIIPPQQSRRTDPSLSPSSEEEEEEGRKEEWGRKRKRGSRLEPELSEEGSEQGEVCMSGNDKLEQESQEEEEEDSSGAAPHSGQQIALNSSAYDPVEPQETVPTPQPTANPAEGTQKRSNFPRTQQDAISPSTGEHSRAREASRRTQRFSKILAHQRLFFDSVIGTYLDTTPDDWESDEIDQRLSLVLEFETHVTGGLVASERKYATSQ